MLSQERTSAIETLKKPKSFYWASCLVSLFIVFGVEKAIAQTSDPVLFFSDITSGPKTGNTDTSLGQTSGQDGAIVTIWGRNLNVNSSPLPVLSKVKGKGEIWWVEGKG